MKAIPIHRFTIGAITVLMVVCVIFWNYAKSTSSFWQKDLSSSVSVNTNNWYRHEDPTESNRNAILEEISNDDAADDFFSRIVYNRVGKCGSRSMQSVISALSKQNRFKFFLSPISNRSHLPILDLKAEIHLIINLKPPMLYSRHIHYINFEKFGVPPPIYINMIRDPIERFSSQYHYKRYGDVRNPRSRYKKPWEKGEKELNINDCVIQNHAECSAEKLWYIIPYFCGQESICHQPSTASLQLAKQHLLNNYLSVGLLEDFEATLKVFERIMPYHFDGAVDIWKEMSEGTVTRTSTVGKSLLKPEVYSILKERMAMEYEFYNFAVLLFKNMKAQLGIK